MKWDFFRVRKRRRICTMNVSLQTFYESSSNSPRLKLAQKIIRFAAQHQIDCICFPAGFFLFKTLPKAKSFLTPLIRIARRYHISFITGFDLTSILQLPRDPNSPKTAKTVKQQAMPSFLLSCNVENCKTSITHQRSSTSAHAAMRLVPDDIMLNPRIMDLGGCEFQIVHCGEVYDKRLFSPGMPKAAVVLGHKTMPRLARTLRTKSEKGYSLINSEHRIGRNGLLFCYDRGKNKSVQGSECFVGEDGTWAELAIWELGSRGQFKPISFPRVDEADNS